jgi:hypothetical protein
MNFEQNQCLTDLPIKQNRDMECYGVVSTTPTSHTGDSEFVLTQGLNILTCTCGFPQFLQASGKIII